MGARLPALVKPKSAPLANTVATSTFLASPKEKQYSPAARSSQEKGAGLRS